MFFKKNTKSIGEITETAAKNYLQQQGLKHVASNYYCRKGEIDLIMLDTQQLIFVEVKYRRNKHYGSGFDVVTKQKQKKLIEAAKYYLHEKKATESMSCRFDVVSLEPFKKGDTSHDNDIKHTNDKLKANHKDFTIHWLQNAFYCE